MDFETAFKDVDPEKAKTQLRGFLEWFCTPAFGALPKREIELEVFSILCELGLVKENATLYDIMTDLRILRSKANALLFDRDVRRLGDNKEELNKDVEDALVNARFAKDGDYFVLEVENPLLNAHIKSILQKLHHISDASFNSALIRMSLDAAAALIEEMIDPSMRQDVKSALVRAGAPDKSLKGVLKSSLKTLGGKILGEAADSVAEHVVEAGESFLSPLFHKKQDEIEGMVDNAWRNIFSQAQQSEESA